MVRIPIECGMEPKTCSRPSEPPVDAQLKLN
jgi:hypothetical protein